MLENWLNEIKVYYLTQNDCYKAGKHITPKGIMLHSTGADNPWLKRYVDTHDGYTGSNLYGNDWNQPGVGACVHAFIGHTADGGMGIVQTLPWDMRSWHCGRSGNDTHISIEVCEDSLTDPAYMLLCLDIAVKTCAALCRKFDLDPLAPGVLVDHAEGNVLGIASAHADIGHWWGRYGYTMDMFRAEVKAAIVNDGPVEPPEEEDEDEDETGCGCTKLEAKVADLEKRIAKLETQLKVYHTLLDVPDWARKDLTTLINDGVLFGTGDGSLDLTMTQIRALVWMQRIREADKGVG